MHKKQGNDVGFLTIPAVNFHLWGNCNMECKFCFARFEKGVPEPKEIRRQKALQTIRAVHLAGVKKITFAGGEPLLCPWLGDALALSKTLGLTTMIVTNGSLVTDEWLESHANDIDWIAISVDSLIDSTNIRLGRAVWGQNPVSAASYLYLAKLINRSAICLKINLTVSAYNKEENLCDFLMEARPKRLKVFQVLPITGQNDSNFETLKVTQDEFASFLKRHEDVRRVCPMIAEPNDAMIDSYLMIDPQGRFYCNAYGSYRYSQPIWRVGWDIAFSQIQVSPEKFYRRNGLYDWQPHFG